LTKLEEYVNELEMIEYNRVKIHFHFFHSKNKSLDKSKENETYFMEK